VSHAPTFHPDGLTAETEYKPMETESRSRRVLRYCAVLTGVVVLLGLGFAPLLRVMGSFLVAEDPLRPAAAIVVLGG
jgi:hypothetical protein